MCVCVCERKMRPNHQPTPSTWATCSSILRFDPARQPITEQHENRFETTNTLLRCDWTRADAAGNCVIPFFAGIAAETLPFCSWCLSLLDVKNMRCGWRWFARVMPETHCNKNMHECFRCRDVLLQPNSIANGICGAAYESVWNDVDFCGDHQFATIVA